MSAGALGDLRAREASRPLDLPTYRALMAYPIWHLVMQALVITRWYEKGLELGLRLLAFTDQHRHEFSPHEIAANKKQRYSFVLDQLDRLDEWETGPISSSLTATHCNPCRTCGSCSSMANRSTSTTTSTPVCTGSTGSGWPTRDRPSRRREFSAESAVGAQLWVKALP